MHVVKALADATVQISCVPDDVVHATQKCILDAISAAVAGFFTPGAIAARRGAARIWGVGGSTIWFDSSKSNLAGASFANAAATSILDIDDGHRAAAGHPGASIIPAVLAAAEEFNSEAPRCFAAIALGYEIGVRIAAARDMGRTETLVSGRWCGQGAAAATGWLREASPGTIAHAIAISGAVAPFMTVAEYTQVGNHIKEAIPFATANGVSAVDLAQTGTLGPTDILDDNYYDPNVLLNGFGSSWLIKTTYFKPYSCCRWAHAALDIVLDLRAHHPHLASRIQSIRVETFGRALTLNNQIAPATLQAAQYSIPFCLAVALVHGRAALAPMIDPALLVDQDVLNLSSRVELVVSEEFDPMFPAAVPARVTISTPNEQITETSLAPRGEPTNPMSWDDLLEKFDTLAARSIDGASANELRQGILRMREGELTPLLSALGRRVMPRTPEVSKIRPLQPVT